MRCQTLRFDLISGGTGGSTFPPRGLQGAPVELGQSENEWEQDIRRRFHQLEGMMRRKESRVWIDCLSWRTEEEEEEEGKKWRASLPPEGPICLPSTWNRDTISRLLRLLIKNRRDKQESRRQTQQETHFSLATNRKNSQGRHFSSVWMPESSRSFQVLLQLLL